MFLALVRVSLLTVKQLEELRELHKAKSSEDDRWRAYSYGKCAFNVTVHFCYS